MSTETRRCVEQFSLCTNVLFDAWLKNINKRRGLPLVPYLLPYKRTLYLALAALLPATGAQLSLPMALRYLIYLALLADNADTIDRYFLAQFGVTVAFGLFSAFRFYLVTWLGERVVADIRAMRSTATWSRWTRHSSK